MTWNWQQKDWPNFTYDKSTLQQLEADFLKNTGLLQGMLKYLPEEDKLILMVDMMSDEALKTSEIEGDYLNRESIQSSIRCNFGLDTDNRRVPPAERGIANLLVDLYKTYSEPLTHQKLFCWHEYLTDGRRDLLDIGKYRTHPEPMQVISGSYHKQKIHFVAPTSKEIPKEMDRFIQWFNTISFEKSSHLPILTRAGIAHLYFVCIHPFEDGNGRIARAIAEKSLSQSLQHPTLISLSHVIQKHKKDYYQALENNNKFMEITDWLVYFAKTVIEAQLYSQSLIEFIINKSRILDRLKGQLNTRQNRALLRMFKEGPEGFKGGLSANNYIRITDASRATATRDLQDLVEKDILLKTGDLKGTRYHLILKH